MLNVGLRCDLTCEHCHHACSPDRVEIMSRDTLQAALRFAEKLRPALIDVTGGEPVLYPHLGELLGRAHAARLPLRVRTNLIALARPGAEDLPARFAQTGARVLASLPIGSAAEITGARGHTRVTWDAALAALGMLSALGYGRTKEGDALTLDLACNPPFGELPRPQAQLEAGFRDALERLGVRFGHLLCITNVPVGRLGDRLRDTGQANVYADLLRKAFNPEVVPALECRHGLEIAWDGTLWDCDFNLAAGVRPVAGPLTLATLADDPASLASRRIGFGPHCFACTAGAGSS